MLNPEEEREIVTLLASKASQSATAIVTGHTQDAVRRVNLEGEKWENVYQGMKFKPTEWTRIFQGVADDNDKEDVELVRPTPLVSQQVFRRLSRFTRGDNPTTEMLKDLRETTRMFEALDAFDEWSEQVIRATRVAAPTIRELAEALAKQRPGC